MRNNKNILNRFIFTAIIICTIFVGLKNTSIAHAAENQWKIEDFTLPEALRGACVEYVDGKMYVIGGGKGSLKLVDTVHIYDFKNKTWTVGKSMSKHREFAASTVVNGKIYLIGGYEVISNNYSSRKDVEIYDIATDTWTSGVSMPLNTVHAKSLLYDNKIYVFGGMNLNTGQTRIYHKVIQIFDLEKGTWSSDTALPFARYGYTLNKVGNKVYLIGGRDESEYCNEVKIFDLTKGTWEDGVHMLTDRYCASSSSYNNKIYIYGGTNPDLLSSTEIYDIETNTWNKGVDLNIIRYCTDSIMIDNKMYVIGGQINTNIYEGTNTIESFQFPSTDNRLFAHLYINEKTPLSFSYDLTDNRNLTWESSDTSVATVDNNGMVTALETGTTNICAYDKNGTYLDYIPVIVTENDVYRMAVHLNIEQKQKLYMKGNPSGITWSSMDSLVACVSANGEVTGISKGLAIIKAEWNEEEHYIYIRVS